MKVWLAVIGCGVALVAIGVPTSAGPLVRVYVVAGLFAIGASVLWPKVRAYPESPPQHRFGATATVLPGPAVPTELERLSDEINAAGPNGLIGTETLVHLRYVARFRLVVHHRLDPDDAVHRARIEQLLGPYGAIIVSPWPPDAAGRAQPPMVPARHLRDLVTLMAAL